MVRHMLSGNVGDTICAPGPCLACPLAAPSVLSANVNAVYRQTIPFLVQAAKQGFQDMGVKDLMSAHAKLAEGTIRVECRSNAAQAEGNVHDMYSFDKVRW